MDERFPRVGGVLSYFVRHRTAANLLLVILIVAGVAAFPRMRAQFFPDVIIDSVRVGVTWQGAGAEDVDRAIVQLLEPALLSVEGVESSEATSREGSANIQLEFEPGWDMSRAVDDVQAAVDTVSNLPEDAEEPQVRRRAWRDRVTDIVITGPVGVDQLGRFADELLARLFAAGVTRTAIRGIAAPQTVVETPSLALVQNDISMREIADAIAGEAEADPAGDVDGANTRVRTGVAKTRADAIVLRSNPDGSKLTIGDIGTVTVGDIDRERAYFVGEDAAISIRVDRSNRGDAIDIQRTVERVADEFMLTLPDSVSIELIRTRAEAITGRLNILLKNGLLGLGLVVLLLFLFLNARTAFWVAAGIPVAMTAAIAMMYDLAVRADHHARNCRGRCHRRGRTRGFPCQKAGRSPGRSGRKRRPAHVPAGSFGDSNHNHRVFRSGDDRRQVRKSHRRHSIHGNRGACRVAAGVFPDSAEPYGPFDRPLSKAALVRFSQPCREHRIQLVPRKGFSAAGPSGDPGALSGTLRRCAGSCQPDRAVHRRRSPMAVFQCP